MLCDGLATIRALASSHSRVSDGAHRVPCSYRRIKRLLPFPTHQRIGISAQPNRSMASYFASVNETEVLMRAALS
jgi:hypothetical protein